MAAYELRRDSVPVRLERQPMELLILLVQRRRELVSRAQIVERLWRGDVYVEVETSINTAVRKVRLALGDSATAPRFIERVAGKGYRFIAPVEVVSAAEADTTPAPVSPGGAKPRMRRWIPYLAGIGLVTVLLAAALLSWGRGAGPADQASPRVVPLTRLAGAEEWATLSPDGNQVAFSWSGEREDDFDLYLTVVGSSEVRRLTRREGADLAPAWSPDGTQIAYVYIERAGSAHQLRVVSPLGGSDRAVNDFPALFRPAWSPDGRYLAVGRTPLPGDASWNAGIHLVPESGGEARALTQALPFEIDILPAFSPDGRRLAYASCRDATFSGDCRVRIVDVDGTLTPIGQPRQVTPRLSRVRGIAWGSDGRFLVYSGGWSNFRRLWRVDADGQEPPKRIEEAGFDSTYPTIAGSRLVFTRRIADTDIHRYDLGAGSRTQPVARSSGLDLHPRFSPDGQRITFCSDRSGDAIEIWIADRDGRGARQLTRGPGREQCSPSWSPDGRRIAFDSAGDDGSYRIWMVEEDGGGARQITNGRGSQYVPTWSADGRWIYFSWEDGSVRNIWRVHVETGEQEQLTRDGSGLVGFETADGTSLVYLGRRTDPAVLVQPLSGRLPHTIVPCVAALSPGSGGFYYVPCQAARNGEAEEPIHFYDLASGRDRRVGAFERHRSTYATVVGANAAMTFDVSPDGRILLYTRRVVVGSDLMLIEDFR